MKIKRGANERSPRLKYRIQTSDCSLHTNAYYEAITTPTEESVRRAMAIQLIINREWGVAKNENPNQGAFVIDELTDLVEEAVLKEFEAIASRGGVLGAMETGYQRGKIQEESMYYEHKKHDGSYPIIGVNTFLKLLARPDQQRPVRSRRTVPAQHVKTSIKGEQHPEPARVEGQQRRRGMYPAVFMGRFGPCRFSAPGEETKFPPAGLSLCASSRVPMGSTWTNC